MANDPAALQIARLQARVAALEAALERRSGLLRKIQEHVCVRDLVLIGRLEAGLPPLPRFAADPLLWQETTEPLAADVDEVLADLWLSLTPAAANTATPEPTDDR
jgi:hypothetical protein